MSSALEFEGVPVSDLLTTTVLRNATVLAGGGGLSNRIQRVNVMEVPDVLPWVREAEFLMTTGYPFRDNPESLADLIPEFVARGVAAFAIKTHRFIDELPPSVVQVANNLSFPIIELPPDTAFSETVRVLMQRILGSETDAIASVQSRIQSLVREFVHHSEPEAILDALEGVIGNPVILVYRGDVRYSTSAVDWLADALDSFVERVQAEAFDPYPLMVRIGERIVRMYCTEVTQHEGCPLHLLAFEKSHEFSPVDLLTIHHLSPFLGLHWVHLSTWKTVETLHRDTFVRNWLRGLMHEDTDILRASQVCKSLTLGSGPYCVLIATSSVSMSETRRAECLDLIRDPLDAMGMYPIIDEECLAVIVSAYSTRRAEQCHSTFNRLLAQSRTGSHSPVAFCVGKPISSTKDVRLSYEEAQRVAWVRGIVGLEQDLVRCSDLGVYRILSHVPLNEDIRQYLEEWVEPILQYDHANHADLLNTLETFFTSNSNIAETARKMYTHPNTISYRLERAKQILGVDPRDSSVHLQWLLALRLYHWHYCWLEKNGPLV